MGSKPRKPEQSNGETPWEKYQKVQKQHAEEQKQKPYPRIGKKLPKLKQQKKRQLSRRMGVLLGSFSVVLLLAVYFVSPLSHISTISISGNHEISKSKLKQTIGVSTGDSIYSIVGRKQSVIAKAKKAMPRIKSLSLDVSVFSHLTVRVSEYPTAGYVADKNHYRVALESGVVSNETQQQPTGNFPVYDKFKSQATLHKMIVQFSKLPADLKGGISEIQYVPTESNPERIHAYMNDGNEVYASLSSFAKKMAYYPSIASKMKTNGVVNLEIGAYSYPFKS